MLIFKTIARRAGAVVKTLETNGQTILMQIPEPAGRRSLEFDGATGGWLVANCTFMVRRIGSARALSGAPSRTMAVAPAAASGGHSRLFQATAEISASGCCG